MVDVFTKKKRSEVMSLIKSKNTQAEKIVFSFLRSKKINFQKHYKSVVGCPDIAFPRRKKAVFVDGDFWHGRGYDRLKERLPKGYWRIKIKANLNRDRRQRRALKLNGWRILRLWESDLKRKRTRPTAFRKIEEFLKNC